MSAVLEATRPDMTDVLLAKGRLSSGDLARAKRLQEASGESLPAIFLKLGLVAERDLAEAFAESLQLKLLTGDDYPTVPPWEEEVISFRFLKEHRAIPIEETADHIVFAVANPDPFTLQALQLACAKPVLIHLGLPADIDVAFERLFGGGRSAMGQIVESIGGRSDDDDDIEHLKDLASEAPVVRLVNLMIARALESRASDIHIEPFENRLKVRYRIDGVMQEVESPPSKLSAAVVSRVKIMAKLNIAERRLPQDGRIQIRVQGKELDLRVSTVPTLYGESVVMRLLDKSGVVLDFDALGFSEDILNHFLQVLELPHGIILVTGPTGSGKTTTLYTALKRLNTPVRKILTVEDPVEYQLEGINQIQVKPQIDLTFARALRAIVRQDPDIILIGEIRDLETASIAVQSALTGHLVLSTLHTNDAASSVTRLLDMGVEDFLLTSTVNGVLAQRLVRVLCPHCKTPYEALPELVDELDLRRFAPGNDPIVLHKPVGCVHCNGIGYRRRMCISEFLPISDPLRALMLKRATAGDLAHQARLEGMITMYEDGLRKAIAGHTTIEEVVRVTQES